MIFEQIVQDGSFVRKEENGWCTVKESLAREKISQGFRNHLNDQYRSSKAAKQNRRKELREEVKSFGPDPKKVKLECNAPIPSRTLRRTSDAYHQLMKFSNTITRASLRGHESEEGPEEVISNNIEMSTDEKEHRRLSIISVPPTVLCDDFNVMEEISQLAFDAPQRGQGNLSDRDGFSMNVSRFWQQQSIQTLWTLWMLRKHTWIQEKLILSSTCINVSIFVNVWTNLIKHSGSTFSRILSKDFCSLLRIDTGVKRELHAHASSMMMYEPMHCKDFYSS